MQHKPMSPEVNITEIDGVKVVGFGPHTVLDTERAEEVSEVLLKLTDPPPCGLIIDLTNVEFLASRALSVLIQIYHALEQKHFLRLVGMNMELLQIFQMTNLNQLFSIDESQEAALQQLRLT